LLLSPINQQLMRFLSMMGSFIPNVMAISTDDLSFGNEYLQGGKIQIPRKLDPVNGMKRLTNGYTKTNGALDNTAVSSEPAYGKRLIAHTVDDLAAREPDRVWATIPLGPEISDGFRDITVKQLASAVNSVAWWIESKIGRSDYFEVLAYLGLSDVRYAILFFAAVKCGYVVC
jgi:hypothetical protein